MWIVKINRVTYQTLTFVQTIDKKYEKEKIGKNEHPY